MSDGKATEGSISNPVPKLREQEGSVICPFPSSNSVLSTNHTNGPQYSAHVRYPDMENYGFDGSMDMSCMYMADEPVSVLGCTAQIQFYNPSLSEDGRCTR